MCLPCYVRLYVGCNVLLLRRVSKWEVREVRSCRGGGVKDVPGSDANKSSVHGKVIIFGNKASRAKLIKSIANGYISIPMEVATNGRLIASSTIVFLGSYQRTDTRRGVTLRHLLGRNRLT